MSSVNEKHWLIDGRPITSSTQKKKACTECRQQKAKCDAYLNPNDACSRCKRLGIQCTISAPFRRENKRQRLSELEKETDTLRKRLMTEDYQPTIPTPTRTGRDNNPSTLSHETPSTAGYHTPQPLPTEIREPVSFPEPSHANNGTSGRQAPTTTPRTLDGVNVSANDINNIFELFFHEYSPFLPILDYRLSPDACYQQSPLLFWSIIGTACRSYSRNPTLLGALTKGIITSALLSVTVTGSPLHRVQSFLLLVTWPLPDAVETNQQETNYVLAGLLLHLAQRSGLHVPAGSDEFFRAKAPNLPDIGIVGRSELWTQIVLTYQRTCLCKGFFACTSAEFSPEMDQFQARQQTLPAGLILRLKWQDLCIRCGAAISENGTRNMTQDQDRALSIIIRTFEAQIKDLEKTAVNESDRLECNIARLYVRSFYFLKQDKTSFASSFDKIQEVARRIIADVEKLVHQTSNPVSIPYYIASALLFASYALLRILKSSIPFLSGETEEARTAFFIAIGLTKRLSIDTNDICSKSVTYLTQLWNSSKAFKRADGTDQLGLRARSRLSGSHVVDTIIWWREEFDPHFKAQMRTLKNSALGKTSKLIVVHSMLADIDTCEDLTDPSGSSAQSNDAAPDMQQQPIMDFGDNSIFDFDYFMGADLPFSQDLFNFPGLDNAGSNNT
ncbi:hypothetical protein D6C84_01332 [Aureobasidium pullulans]|uniref:Zn(2)-C6 fungal-type domain-containing protein n=1 Tax=Aureobasidium pullulans TaxID=5580 RepID=A0A4S9Y771_AURPU|nr:hypothetical protein D6C84_01332 [Aureobasidium pullulans]